ncbi:LADA_0F01838g1_1 [Lachancea dasiensis]|uniref:LADA_0F01838g1_1 n=1 Tax=Lachancea dasiensis TaxID=1072105 RepID=A0A1G4JI58_9SACH|nr:LADA_0F01838g1_1 [Lachancea dasiensis]
MKTCYYELLDVETTASDSDLKKAYRRKALQYHPDKNPNNVDEATAIFANIRAAYEVLADPQERAWYDSHKNQILRDDFDIFGDGYGSGDEYEVDTAVTGITTEDLLQFFNTSLYSRIDDSPAGFYQVAGKVFAKLAGEEVRFGRMQGLPKYDGYQDSFFESDVNTLSYRSACEKYSRPLDAPTMLFPVFGDSSADFQHLQAFYRAWSGFSTVKTFSWKDEYMYSSNYDRRTKRELKKRNEKLRQQAKSEYNKTVKRFVSFIKKFDTRMKEGAAKFEQEKRRKMREDLQRQIEKDRKAQSEGAGDPFKLQSWQTVDDYDWGEIEKQYDEGLRSNKKDDTGASGEGLTFECFICNKTFKSAAQLENHNTTKVHKKNLRLIQREMQKDNLTLGLDAISDVDDFDSANEGALGEDEKQMALQELEAELKRIEEELEGISDDSDMESDAISSPPEQDEIGSTIASEELQQKGEGGSLNSELNSDVSDAGSSTGDFRVDDKVDNDFEASPRIRSCKNKRDELSDLLKELDSSLDFDYEGQVKDSDDGKSWSASKKSKKGKKNDYKASSTLPQGPEMSLDHMCQICGARFGTRNSLFSHIEQEEHAAPIKKVKSKKSARKARKI